MQSKELVRAQEENKLIRGTYQLESIRDELVRI